MFFIKVKLEPHAVPPQDPLPPQLRWSSESVCLACGLLGEQTQTALRSCAPSRRLDGYQKFFPTKFSKRPTDPGELWFLGRCLPPSCERDSHGHGSAPRKTDRLIEGREPRSDAFV